MPALQAQVIQRFAELARAAEEILQQDHGSSEPQTFYAWASSALNLLHGVFGESSPHYVRLHAEISAINSNYISDRQLRACRGTFLGAKGDAEGGYLFRLEASIAGEVFGDFVSLAKASLAEGSHTVAAVLACAALEDALKRFAVDHGLSIAGKTMEEVVNALKSNGLVSGAQKSLLGAMPRIRNYAMHAEWQKLSPQDAGSVIGFVEQFLLAHFP
jgi:hypothetical protein